jgi:hypothetical protein
MIQSTSTTTQPTAVNFTSRNGLSIFPRPPSLVPREAKLPNEPIYVASKVNTYFP